MPLLPELATALLDPKAYPEAVTAIDLIQTQMSFVFLTGEHAFKIKKPVDFGYLNFTTLERRHYYCQQEVELNRRLCADVYLGVVTVNRGHDSIAFQGPGEVIEYAVKMRRLPHEAMMDALLANNRVTAEMVEEVARKLYLFHRSCDTSNAIAAFGRVAVITANTGDNFKQVEKYLGRTISKRLYQCIRRYTEEFINQHSQLFERRITGGRIKDCHGDLHAAHICFTDGICIYDCIEFNDCFRYGDVASEVAFLAMDLDHFGRADLSRQFINTYVRRSEDSELGDLLRFYKCYRAFVRGKVESFQLDDPGIDNQEKEGIQERACSYFDLAGSYVNSVPALFITCGPTGTGKTTLAQALASRLGAVVISSDIIRKQLAGVPVTEHRFNEFGSGIYSEVFSRRTYSSMLNQAAEILKDGDPVILDASFLKASERRQAKELAGELGRRFFILECHLNEAILRERLRKRLDLDSISDGRWETYESQRMLFQPVLEENSAIHVIIDTSRPATENIRQIIDRTRKE